MKAIKNKHFNRRFIIITISTIVITTLVAGGVYAYRLQTQPSTQTTSPPSSDSSNINYDKPTDEQQQAGNDAKENAVNNDDTPTTSDITITSTNQTDGVLRIRTQIGAVDDNGTCTLLMTMADAADITMTVGTQTLGSYSVCKGFDIPTTDIKKGVWQATVTYSSGNKTSSATQQIQVE